MTDEQPPDSARRNERPATGPENLPYDEEMTEADEANAPDMGERDRTDDEELGTPNR